MNRLGALRRDLLDAADGQVARVVAMVDRMTERGAADALIAPLRPRLAMLRPDRALSLTRLLFLPLDRLIVPAPAWRPGEPSIPRSVLVPLAAALRAALPAQAMALDAMLDGHTTADATVLIAAGGLLWPAAAALLRSAPPPPRWHEATGLPVALHDPLVRPMAALLAEGMALHQLACSEDAAAAAALLRRVAASGPAVLAMAVALVMAILPDAGEVLRLAEELAGQGGAEGRAAVDRALDFLIEGTAKSSAEPLPLALLADQMRRATLLLDGLAAESATTQRPGRRARIVAARRRLDETCRAQFSDAAAQLAVAAPEAALRDLRRLDAVGRRLGDAGAYDRGLQALARRMAGEAQMAPVERLRSLEILLGPEAALAWG